MSQTQDRSSPPNWTRQCCASAATRLIKPNQRDSRRSLRPIIPPDCPATPAISLTARQSTPETKPEGRNEHYPASHAAPVAGGGDCMEAHPCRDPRSRFQLQIIRSLVEHADRSPQVHRLRELCACVPRSEEHTSELQSLRHLVCRLL